MKVKKIIGHFVDIDEKDDINKEILEKHITHYMQGVSQVLFIAFFLITIFEIAVTLLIKTGHFLSLLVTENGDVVTYNLFVRTQIVFLAIIWVTFGLYYICWKKANFTGRKNLTCILSLVVTTVFCFYYWNNNTLIVLFVVPIIAAVPFDKRRNKEVMISSIILIILYSLLQYNKTKNEVTLLIGCSSIITIIAVQFICIKIHNTMNRSFLDIRAYANKQKVLYDKISHDELTGSFSKTALEADLHNLENYTSLAFIDIDKFKSINDTYGHQMGDNVLKLLVFCMKTDKLHVYRNGGDEFILLSNLSAKELGKDLEVRKAKFSYYSEEFFKVKASVSVGIININLYETGSENIRRCDALMYKSKDKGRDTLTIEE